MITRERWQQIKDLFHLALERPAAQRREFLAHACEGDLSMRDEVASLISAHEEDENFLDAPAYEFAAEMLAEGEAEFAAGQKIDRYTILAVLGSGGMGEVYLAQDGRLGRRIALKLISADFARDEKRVRRFEQEASAALLINHPNVCVIHEIGITEDGRHFIAMEHVEGMTLRDRISLKQLQPAEALQVAIQIAAALEAAHAAGIVHRDIKPENIMRRPDGFIKVLDFGLAKLNEELSRPQDFHEASTARVRTEPGMRMGTVRYMSPEQLREASVDERTDIWSLGVVLYEMVMGNTPFAAPTPNDTVALILGKQSPELIFAEELPLKFEQVIRKALVKDRAQRYQTVTELAADLKLVRRELRRLNEIESSPQGITLPVESVDTKPQPTPVNPTIFFRLKSQAISTAAFLVSEIKQHKKTAIFTGVTAVFALLFMGGNSAGLFKQKTSDFSLQTMKLRALTNSGESVCAAISPDGKSVAHVERKDGMQELVLTGTVTRATSVLVPAGAFEYRGVTFSRDNYYVYFTGTEKGEGGVLYQVTLPFSRPLKIMDGVDSPISFSPNGDRFAFVRLNKATDAYSLMIAGADGTDERVLATRGDGNTLSIYGPAWSPDEQTIVCSAGSWDDDGYRESLTAVNVQDRKESILGNDKWHSVLQVAWLPDGRLIVSAADRPVHPYQLWSVSYPRGETTRITNDVSQYRGVSFSRDTNTLVSVSGEQTAKIWVVPDGDIQRGTAIAPSVGFTYGMSWNSKARIVFSAMAGSNLNISAVDPDGSNQTVLTSNARDNYTPASSPDGRYIVFASNRNGRLNIWRMNAEDGSDLKQLTFSDGNSYPSCSPDGQWVVYDNQSRAGPTIWKVPMDGGAPIQLSREYARMPIVSPDGKLIACRYLTGDGKKKREIAILPFAGGPPVTRAPIDIMDWQSVQWTKDGQALTYIASVNGAANIWRYELAGGATKQLTDFKTDLIFAYAWSPDQKQLACERGNESRDVMIFEEGKSGER